VWAVGHEGTARALARLFCSGMTPPPSLVATMFQRVSVALVPGDCLYVAQPTGRRLEPGEEVAAPDLTYFRCMVYAPGEVARLKSAGEDMAEELAYYQEHMPR